MKTGDNQREPLAVHVRGLRMRYGPTDVLRGVDLTVGPGEVVALLGPNGAGKTTTVEVLEGFRRRSAGDVRVLGVDPDRGDEAWRARLGVVLQSWRDHGRWRVRELLSYLALLHRPYRERVFDPDELIGLVGLADRAHARLGTLSGGQRRRVDVAVGLVGHPDLLFLDEPTVGFDPAARRAFHELVRRLPGTAILLTTHDLAEAEKLADRIVVLVAGRVVADGTADELAARFAGEAEVRYRLGGEAHVVTVPDATRYVRELFAEHGPAVADLEVRRASLEDAYLALVRESEAVAA
ncbi:ABC transporter ATP-binding protein [Actinosynnema sp. NPDC059335]|uniref:ABC transporter ATP-binding protein n=1 Tax=Actinosynnema sp. NPDC059335 TaxID=3346804 RepID=UPI00366D76F4